MNQKKRQQKRKKVKTPYGIKDEELGKYRELGKCRKCKVPIGLGNEKARHYVNGLHDIDGMAKKYNIKLHPNVVSKKGGNAIRAKNLTDLCYVCVAESVATYSTKMNNGKGNLSNGTVNVSSGNEFKSKAAYNKLTQGIQNALKPLLERYQIETGEKVDFCGVIGMYRDENLHRFKVRPICTERNNFTLAQRMVNVYKEVKTNGAKRDLFDDIITNLNLLRSGMAQQQKEIEKLKRRIAATNTHICTR